MNDPMPPLPGLSPVSAKPVVARFDGGHLSSDGGVLLLREIAERLGFAERLAACIDDPRDQDQIVHTLAATIQFGRLLTGVDMAKGRAEIVRLAGFEPGSQVLEVSPGPGVSHPLLREALGPASRIVAADLSLNMLRECRRRHGSLGVVPIQANALHLPFAHESFDALFHFGGVNLFSDPGQALSEFVRVVRRGGRIVWGDEHMSERYSDPIGLRVLPRINPGFRKTPPAPPQGAEVLGRHEVYGGLGYLVVARRRG